jgi:hypothetical protein
MTDLAVQTIERCLHFVCLPQERLNVVGGLLAVRHVFYHLMHTEASCSFEGGGDPKDELEILKKIAPFFDFVELNMRDGFMEPLFIFPLDFPITARLVSGQNSPLHGNGLRGTNSNGARGWYPNAVGNPERNRRH